MRTESAGLSLPPGFLDTYCYYPLSTSPMIPRSVYNDPKFSEEWVTVRFTLLPTGEIRNIYLTEGSWFPVLDSLSLYKVGRLSCKPIPGITKPEGVQVSLRIHCKRD
jgi:hypothetical protein